MNIFVPYEKVHPDDGFGIVIQKNFESISSPLLSLTWFPTLPSQELRYVSRVGMNISKLSARAILPNVRILCQKKRHKNFNIHDTSRYIMSHTS